MASAPTWPILAAPCGARIEDVGEQIQLNGYPTRIQHLILRESEAEAICLVPENRTEVTTEGGLDVRAERRRIERVVPQFKERNALVSLFIDPEREQLRIAADTGAPFVELHTGAYANARGSEREREFDRLADAADFARERGLRVNAGHGLDYENVTAVARIGGIEELNIGFAIVARSLFVGVDTAIAEMLALIGARKKE